MSDDLIYEVIDKDSDKLTVETADTRHGAIYVSADKDGVYLTADEVDTLRSKLAPYGTPALDRDGVREIVRLVHQYGDRRATRAKAPSGVFEPSSEWLTADKACDRALGDITTALADLLDRPAPESTPSLFEELTQADLADLGDPGRLVLTEASFPLDARRMSALEKAAELAGRNALGGQSFEAVLGYALFLLDEMPKAAA